MTDLNNYRNPARYAGLATQWLVMLGAAVWIGLKLDKLTGWKFPLFVVTLPLIALCFSLWQLIREFNKPKK
jgi:hypothetical protein